MIFTSPDRQFRLARLWSNNELRRIATLFTGSVVNVSAGEDNDKEGGEYINYFRYASSYSMTNCNPGSYRGYMGRVNEILLDLTNPLPLDLINSFDVVFNHTTLEHIFQVKTAFKNLCELSRDVVILVVPFCQVQHENEGYRDYWRFTPTCIRKLFHDEGMSVIYESSNNDFNAAVYLFVVASRNPAKWKNELPEWRETSEAASWVGRKDVPWREIIRLLAMKFSGLLKSR